MTTSEKEKKALSMFFGFIVGMLLSAVIFSTAEGATKHCIEFSPSTGKCLEYKTTDQLVKEVRSEDHS